MNETSLEQALIDIADFRDERGLRTAIQGMKLIVPRQLQFTANRLMESTLRTSTADNDINAIRNMGVIPQGYTVNHYLNDADAFFIKTDAPNGFKHFHKNSIKQQLWKVILIQVISDTKQERDTHSVSQIHVAYLVHLVHNN